MAILTQRKTPTFVTGCQQSDDGDNKSHYGVQSYYRNDWQRVLSKSSTGNNTDVDIPILQAFKEVYCWVNIS